MAGNILSSHRERFKHSDRIYNFVFCTVGLVIIFKTVFLGIRIYQEPYWGDFGDYLYNYSEDSYGVALRAKSLFF